ncbi:hypothetical protein GCM10007388_33960 [Pseudoduganella plicata]|uniref:Glycosyl hydrolase family 92 domain-containing protein n=1 Tax=Pseudoduganella plicata TaxID=321984 RepID=A0AA87YEB0_9BURK|nr:hypothetical protein GCM10007388_33960 [Pseudoduganella plicata]
MARQLVNREEGVEYKGFAPPGKTPAHKVLVEGKALVAALDSGVPADGTLLVKVALSPVSEDNAIANLEEMPGWDFDAERRQAGNAWNDALSTVAIDAPEPMRTMVYTSLYHAMLTPSLFMDRDGSYRGPDNAVHKADCYRFHSTFSLWDTYRALHPLLTLTAAEERNGDFIRSLIASRQHSPHGILPVWQFHGLETWCMMGYHAVPVISDAYMKGIKGFDPEQAPAAMTASAEYGPYGGLEHYMKLGYVPIDLEPEAASKTVEYAFDDWRSRGWRKRWASATSPRGISSARRTGATSSTRRQVSCAPANRRANSARHSIPCSRTSAATTRKAAPGSTHGVCRTTTRA